MLSSEIIPSPPRNECDRTSLPVDRLEGVPAHRIEEEICSCDGKVQIIGDEILRDMVECHRKSQLSGLFTEHFGSFLTYKVMMAYCLGTDATKYDNGWVLSPDMSVWREENSFDHETSVHMYREGTAPHHSFWKLCRLKNEMVKKKALTRLLFRMT